MDKLEKIKRIKFIYSLVIQLFVYLFSELFEFDNIFIVVAINSIIYLLKNKKSLKDVLILIGLLLLTSILSGYIIILIMNLI